MSFTVDKQTLDDLNLLGKYRSNSIYNVFSRTHTQGGEMVLEQMFRNPLSDADAINKRSAVFEYFQQKNLEFPFDRKLLDAVEYYLSTPAHSKRAVSYLNNGKRKLMQCIAADQAYELIGAGVVASIQLLDKVESFYAGLDEGNGAYSATISEVMTMLHSKEWERLKKLKGVEQFPFRRLVYYDYCLRARGYENLRRLMNIIYELDVYMTGAAVAAQRGFSRAVAYPSSTTDNRIDLVNVFHPQVRNAVANSICISHNQNVLFLTGANMAGKSTFMKSFGVAVYMAHMGFPVAAEKMEFTVQDGLYTSINVSDNLNMGYSHFYAEVLRVKFVASEVAAGKNMVIILDELFKGTNVKDAYDATVAVIEAFSIHQNCSFIISTHILEAGQTLHEKCPHFKFAYLPTVMEGRIPRYTYRLTDGITADRHGMQIITNEHIVDFIRLGSRKIG